MLPVGGDEPHLHSICGTSAFTPQSDLTPYRTSAIHTLTITISVGLPDHQLEQKHCTAVMRTWQTSTRAWLN